VSRQVEKGWYRTWSSSKPCLDSNIAQLLPGRQSLLGKAPAVLPFSDAGSDDIVRLLEGAMVTDTYTQCVRTYFFVVETAVSPQAGDTLTIG
jgi:hypothetical protein